MRKGAVAFIFNKKGEALCVTRPKKDKGADDVWAIPGGKVEQGETSRQAIAREIQEETGLMFAEKEFKLILQKEVKAADERGEDFDISVFYMQQTCSGDESVQAEEGHKIQWLRLDKVFNQKVEQLGTVELFKEAFKEMVLKGDGPWNFVIDEPKKGLKTR